MTEPVKFQFDQQFDGGAKNRYDEEVLALRDEMAHATHAALEKGIEEGRNQALQEIEAATLDSLGKLQVLAQDLMAQHADIENKVRDEAVQLAYMIASKLAPALMDKQPMAEIETLVIDCLKTVRKEPRLVIRVSENQLDTLSSRIETLQKNAGFEGNIVVVGEAELGHNDCLLEWAEGGTARRYGDIQQEVEHLVQKYVMTPTFSVRDKAEN